MSEKVEGTTVTARAKTDSLERQEAFEVMQRLADQELAVGFSCVSNIDEIGDDELGDAEVVVGDDSVVGSLPGERPADSSAPEHDELFGVSAAGRHLLRAGWADGRIEVEFQTELSAVAHVVEMLEPLFEITRLHVGGEDGSSRGLRVEIHTGFAVGPDYIDTPSRWMAASLQRESTLELRPVSGFTAENPGDLVVRLARANNVVWQLEDETAAEHSPLYPVEKLYGLAQFPGREGSLEVLTFAEQVAHPESAYRGTRIGLTTIQIFMNLLRPAPPRAMREAGDIDPSARSEFELDAKIQQRALDESAIETWLGERQELEAVFEPNSARLVAADAKLVEAHLTFREGGESRSVRNEHLVARADGLWKVVL